MTADQILSRHNDQLTKYQSADKVGLFRWLGFADNGVGYVYEGGADPEQKADELAEIKSQGYRYCTRLRMFVSRLPAVLIQTYPIDLNNYIVWGKDSRWHLVDDVRFQVEREIMRQRSIDVKHGFLGEVGRPVSVQAKLIGSRIVASDSDFGDFTVLYFKDADGNNISWFQRTYSADTIRLLCKRQKTDWVDIVGKVKKLSRRCGMPVTDLTRCELSVKGWRVHDFAEKLRNKKNNTNIED